MSNRELEMKTRFLTGAAMLTLMVCAHNAAFAQSAPRADEAADTDEKSDEIIVTGTSTARSKFETSYAASVLSADQIQELAPISLTDLLGNLPGVQPESSGGEVQNVFRVRGLPDEGNFQSFQQNGVSLYQGGDGPFFKNDVLGRVDLMTERVEFIRGGPAPVFASNAAAIFNQITRKGSDVSKGAVRVTVGDTGLYRLDGYQSGPLGSDTHYAVGGFLRQHDGYRPAGYPSDRGGQIRANITHDLSNGGEVMVYAQYLNDKNVFYLPIPIADPRNPNVSLNGLIDANNGTLNTRSLLNTRLRYSNDAGGVVTENRDLSHGRNTRFTAFGLQYNGPIGGDWNLSSKFNASFGKLDFDAVYSTRLPLDANVFSASSLVAAQAAFPTATRLGYALAGTNGATVYDPQASALGLVLPVQYRTAFADFYSTVADVTLSRNIETGLGTHDVTFGALGSFYGTKFGLRYQDYLFELRNQPRPLDLVAYNAANVAVGFVTSGDGVLAYSTALNRGKSDVSLYAFFLNDTWQVTDKLRIDGGIRYEKYKFRGFGLGTRLVNLGDATTLADNSTRAFDGSSIEREFAPDSFNWTVGANYDFSDSFGIYARASRAYRAPFEVNTIFGGDTKGNVARQYEIGLKVQTPVISAYVIGFQTKFDPLNLSLDAVNPQTGTVQRINFVGNASTTGVEADIDISPTKWFTLSSTITYGDPKYNSLTADVGASPGNVEGNRIVREAAFYGNVSPSVKFDVGGGTLDAYVRLNFIGTRFVDVQNNTRLPAFETLAAGASYNTGDWSFQVAADNLTNTVGLTEGNPRIDAVAGQGSANAIYARPIFGRNFRFIVTKKW
jgi:iron complex outermembrane recepter protein